MNIDKDAVSNTMKNLFEMFDKDPDYANDEFINQYKVSMLMIIDGASDTFDETADIDTALQAYFTAAISAALVMYKTVNDAEGKDGIYEFNKMVDKMIAKTI